MGGVRRGALLLMAQAFWVTPALAHASERGQIMLLPTELYVLGGGLAVFASVLLVGLSPIFKRWKAPVWEFGFPSISPDLRILTSLISFAVLSMLILAGIYGPADPISNPLPGYIWSLWWVGFTILCLLMGNVWPLFNPWAGLYRLIGPPRPPLRYPAWLGHWPAVAMFFAFAWFQLVYPAPDDPPRLAMAATCYFLVNLLGLLLFGEFEWMRKAEAFSVYFRMVGRLSPFQWNAMDGGLRLRFGLPGHGLLPGKASTWSEGAFVLLALATVTFDGFSQTFFWADQLALNPLEFPGRSAVVFANTVGLALMGVGLGIAYAAAVAAGRFVARSREIPGLVMAIVPIALAYHFAHYLADFPVDALKAIKALSDPFGTGLDILGTADLNPPASIMMDHRVATLVYRLQTAIVVVGHVMAVAVAHFLALRNGDAVRAAALSQAPLNILMVFYTVFGLWLLSTPVIS
ncbi:MAG: hypothetical protein H7X89_02095 [Rhizobiales bacterium]|nr:hypothetical protein [Hyphomicrobiales bacterium]